LARSSGSAFVVLAFCFFLPYRKRYRPRIGFSISSCASFLRKLGWSFDWLLLLSILVYVSLCRSVFCTDCPLAVSLDWLNWLYHGIFIRVFAGFTALATAYIVKNAKLPEHSSRETAKNDLSENLSALVRNGVLRFSPCFQHRRNLAHENRGDVSRTTDILRLISCLLQESTGQTGVKELMGNCSIIAECCRIGGSFDAHA